MKLNGRGPVVGIDLDGTLADYHAHFIRFAEGYTGRSFPDPRDINPALPFRQFLGLGKATYRAVKLAYRQGGLKRSMPVYPHAAELTRNLRRAGCEVWITTSRPYLQLGNVDPDTRHWLRRNSIQYDNLLWGERKYIDLARVAHGDGMYSRVIGVLDDLPEMIDQAFGARVQPVLRRQPYNVHKTRGPKGEFLPVVLDLKEAELVIKQQLHVWRHGNVGISDD